MLQNYNNTHLIGRSSGKTFDMNTFMDIVNEPVPFKVNRAELRKQARQLKKPIRGGNKK